MICVLCNNQAEFYILNALFGKQGNTYICGKCIDNFSTDGYLKLFAMPISTLPQTPKSQLESELECKSCGMTLSNFMKNKRLGCAEDYKLFNLDATLEAYHKANRHVGKFPLDADVSKEVVLKRIETLKDKMGSAVKSDMFEEAARLRDEIRALTRKIGNI